MPPFGGLRGNVHGSSMARWKARGQLLISAIWTCFASYHDWGTMSRYWSKVRCFKGALSFWTKILGEKGRPPPANFNIRKLVPGLSYGDKKAEIFNRLSRAHQRHRQTERRTDDIRQTDGIAIAYSERNVVTFAKNLSGRRILNLMTILALNIKGKRHWPICIRPGMAKHSGCLNCTDSYNFQLLKSNMTKDHHRQKK